MRLTGAAGWASLFLALLPAPAAAGKIDCLSREGQCIAVTVSGRSNWDRHVLFFEVKED